MCLVEMYRVWVTAISIHVFGHLKCLYFDLLNVVLLLHCSQFRESFGRVILRPTSKSERYLPKICVCHNTHEPIMLASAEARRDFLFVRVNHRDDVHERVSVRY